MEHVTAKLDVSERFACRVLGQHRSTRRKAPTAPGDEAALAAGIAALSKRFGRCGHRRVTALLRAEGRRCDHERVERIWRAEGLKAPRRQPERGRLRLNDGSCVRPRPERPDHVWACDFVGDRTRDGRRFRTPNVVDEFTRERLAIRAARKLGSADVIDVLADLFTARGAPAHVRSGNGPELVAKAVRGPDRRRRRGGGLHRAGQPAENGHVESFNGKMRDEPPDAEAFNALAEAKVLIERRRRHYNTGRPHSSLGHRPPSPEVVVPGVTSPPSGPGPIGSAQQQAAVLH